MSDFPALSNLDPVSMLTTAQAPKQQKDDKIAKTAAEFEGMLMGQLFQTLRKTVEPSGLFGDSQSQSERSTYEYLLDQAIVQNAIENGHTWGLAERLEEAWKMSQSRGGPGADGAGEAGEDGPDGPGEAAKL